MKTTGTIVAAIILSILSGCATFTQKDIDQAIEAANLQYISHL